MGCCRCWKVLLASVGGWQMVVMGNCIKQYSKEGRKSHITMMTPPCQYGNGWRREIRMEAGSLSETLTTNVGTFPTATGTNTIWKHTCL